MKVIFFGAGSYAEYLWTQIEKDRQLYLDEYIAFTDNNENCWGDSFCDSKIIAPNEMKNYDVDLIIIASTIYENTIRRQLIEDLRIPKDKIYIWEEYSRWCYARNVYRKRYGAKTHNKSKENESMTKQSTVVYTAITGNYDSLKEPLFIDDN